MDKQDPAETNKGVGKGKGKAKETDDGNPKSVAERLQASGRLALNAVTSPSSQDWASQASGGKIDVAAARSSSNTEARVGEASSHRLQPAGQQGESLRGAQHLSSSSGQAFDEFVGGKTVLPTEDLHSWSGHSHSHSTAVFEQQLQDGAAVVDLLNTASFEPEQDAFGDDDANLDDGMPPHDADKLREALFGPNGNQFQPRWDDLLNFTPEFLNQPGPSLDAQLLMGTSDPAEARSMWLRQWGDVLSAYTDQVWGDLGPLVTEARREVEDLNAAGQGNQKPETKALERLRQILAHVRGH